MGTIAHFYNQLPPRNAIVIGQYANATELSLKITRYSEPGGFQIYTDVYRCGNNTTYMYN